MRLAWAKGCCSLAGGRCALAGGAASASRPRRLAAVPASGAQSKADPVALAKAKELMQVSNLAAMRDQMVGLVEAQIAALVRDANPDAEDKVDRAVADVIRPALKRRIPEYLDLAAGVYADHFTRAELEQLVSSTRARSARSWCASRAADSRHHRDEQAMGQPRRQRGAEGRRRRFRQARPEGAGGVMRIMALPLCSGRPAGRPRLMRRQTGDLPVDPTDFQPMELAPCATNSSPAGAATPPHLAAHGLYDPADEHDACGVGLIAAIDGKPRRQVVEAGIAALKSVWHRGAVDADGKTGDGAGIHVQIPQEFFKEYIRSRARRRGAGKLGVGMVFLPRTDLGAQERCRVIVEREILAYGYTIYGWRQVPVNVEVIGEKANATRPEIEQIMIANSTGDVGGAVRARSLRHPPPHREGGDRGEDQGLLHLLAVLPLGHLQGHVPGRAADGLLSRPARRALRLELRDLSPALFDQHLPDLASGAALPRHRA